MRGSRARFLAGAAAVAAGTRAARGATFDYKLGFPEPGSLPTVISMVQMASAVRKETGGQLNISVFPNSQLGSTASMLSQLRLGSVQMLSLNHSNYATVVPVSQISGLGFVFSGSEGGVPIQAMDGELGAYIRREFAAKGVHVFEQTLLSGYRQMTTWTKPIRHVDDFAGLKVRVIAAPVFVDLFKALGAAPTPLDANELYTSLQTHLVDAQEGPLISLEGFRIFEVQKYLSLTNHIWGGEWVAMNGDAWNSLPPNFRSILERNVAKFAKAERGSTVALDKSLVDKLGREGLTPNAIGAADLAAFRRPLGAYYTRWRNEFGTTAWGLLEAKVGKLI